MPIAKKVLEDTEDVIIDIRLHWLFFLWPLVVTAAAIWVVIAVFFEWPKAPIGVVYVLAALICVPALWLLGRLCRWLTISLIVTTTRVLYRRGVLTRNLTQVRLQRIADVHYRQNLAQRICGCGRLVLEMEGEDAIAVDDLRHIRSLQKAIGGQLDRFDKSNLATVKDTSPKEPRGTDDTPARGTPVVADRLVELEGLHRRGLISQEEYAAKRADLLAEL